eukprot:PhF_6_TR39007/c0_g1_i1/m.58380
MSSSPTTTHPHILLVTTVDGCLSAFDLEQNGDPKWKFLTGPPLVGLVHNDDRAIHDVDPFIPDLGPSQLIYVVENGTIVPRTKLEELMKQPVLQFGRNSIMTSTQVKAFQVSLCTGNVEAEDVRDVSKDPVPGNLRSLRVHRIDTRISFVSLTHTVWEMTTGRVGLTMPQRYGMSMDDDDDRQDSNTSMEGSPLQGPRSFLSEVSVSASGRISTAKWCVDLGIDIVNATLYCEEGLTELELLTSNLKNSGDKHDVGTMAAHLTTKDDVCVRTYKKIPYVISRHDSSDETPIEPKIHDRDGPKMIHNAFTLQKSGGFQEIIVAHRYILQNKLGSGGFGDVYLALDILSGDRVAIKQLRYNGDRPTFQREYEMLLKVQHPHVVRVRDYDVSGPIPSIIMEWMPNGSIKDILDSIGFRFHESLVRKCTRDALMGLLYLHQCGIVHRDIKPHNMLVAADGMVKLTDFGASRILDASTSSCGLSNGHGTTVYMAPEGFHTNLSRACDVWALGCSVIEMLTNRPPWNELSEKFTNVYQYIFHIGNVPPDEQREHHHPKIPDHLSEDGKDFLCKCFYVDPAQRWTCEQLMQHPFILAQQPGDEIHPPPPPPPTPASTPPLSPPASLQRLISLEFVKDDGMETVEEYLKQRNLKCNPKLFSSSSPTPSQESPVEVGSTDSPLRIEATAAHKQIEYHTISF